MGPLLQFAKGNVETAVALGVLMIFVGAGIAAKMQSKWGYVVMAAGAWLAWYALHSNKILGL